MYKNSLLIAVLISGVCASENPFEMGKNIQKIEQEEGALLQAIAKEKKTFEEEEDSLFEESISTPKASQVVPEEAKAHSGTDIVQEPETQKATKEPEEVIEKGAVAPRVEEVATPAVKQEESAATPAKETLKKPQAEEEEEAVLESVPKKSAPVVEKIEESLPSSVEKVPENPAKNEAVKEVEKNKEETKKPLTIREVTDKTELEAVKVPEADKIQPSAEKQIEEIDAKIEKLEEKLEASKTKSAAGGEISAGPDTEANGSAESNVTFEQKLKEAIKSVQD